MGSSDQTWEAQELDRRPAIRKKIAKSPDFQNWVSKLPSIEVDGEKLYLPWGDVPMDKDQVAYVWARDKGLIKPEKS